MPYILQYTNCVLPDIDRFAGFKLSCHTAVLMMTLCFVFVCKSKYIYVPLFVKCSLLLLAIAYAAVHTNCYL
jgi:hypothetical protein